MSFSVVKKSLELFDDKDAKSSKKSTIKPSESSGKVEKKRKHRQKSKKNIKEAAKQSTVTVFEEREKYEAKDCSATNVQLMRELSSLTTASESTVNNILKHQTGRLSKNLPVKSSNKDQGQSGSVFTDKDFDLFEKEYAF